MSGNGSARHHCSVIALGDGTTPDIVVADFQVVGASSRAHAVVGPDQYPLRISALISALRCG
jgi:hypothetical protein